MNKRKIISRQIPLMILWLMASFLLWGFVLNLLTEHVFALYDFLADSCLLKCCSECITCSSGFCRIVECCEPSFSCCLNVCRYSALYELFYLSLELCSSGLNSNSHAHAVLCVVLEE